MKITFGRKFLGCTIATAINAVVYFVTLFVVPAAIISATTIAFGGFTITIWFAYIGGNVWNKYITRKD